MKKLTMGVCMMCVVMMLESCYSSSFYVGDMTPETPAVKVNTKHNSHFINGLIGEGEVNASNYVGGAESYKVKHQLTFLDYIISGVTFGIYTPSTTKFYVPVKNVK